MLCLKAFEDGGDYNPADGLAASIAEKIKRGKQKKQQQKMEEERNSMKVGDNVITNGGMYGKIDGINTVTDKKGNAVPESFIIKLKPEYQVRIQVSKDCVFKDLSDMNAAQGK